MRSWQGNFSFAKSLVENHVSDAAPAMFATSFDSWDTAKEKYDDVEANVDELREAGVICLFDVDAGALDKVKTLRHKRFDKIVFSKPFCFFL